MSITRHDWEVDEVAETYYLPLMELIYKASDIHRKHHKVGEVQVSTLLSVKTGACTEDCSYCSQSSRNQTDVEYQKLMKFEEVMSSAKVARMSGSSRFCMGAAWREVKDDENFDEVLKMVQGITDLGMEVCATLGMLNESQADRLKAAGLHAYNHNIDTSEEFYDKVITTRTFQDRLDTIENVQNAGIGVCSGGIIGLGENDEDRVRMLHTLATLPTHPSSVPVNALVPVEGTPLSENKKTSIWEMIRMIATARIIMPKSMVRLSAGRTEMSETDQALCFLSGANSIFAGDKLLTTPNPDRSSDDALFKLLGLRPMAAFAQPSVVDQEAEPAV